MTLPKCGAPTRSGPCAGLPCGQHPAYGSGRCHLHQESGGHLTIRVLSSTRQKVRLWCEHQAVTVEGAISKHAQVMELLLHDNMHPCYTEIRRRYAKGAR